MLRPGTGDPVVFLHPVGGEVLCYGELARVLPGDYPVYALAADDALRTASAPVLTDLAAHNLRRLRCAGLSPRMLAGWSFGGMLAFEMARLLMADGPACPVTVIDTMPFQRGDRPPRAVLIEAFAADLVRAAGHRPEEAGFDAGLWALPPSEAVVHLHGHLERHGMPLGLGADELLDRARIYMNAFSALQSHRPAGHGPPVHVLWATRTATDPLVWWQRVSSEPVGGAAIEADHYSLLRQPVVHRVSRLLHEQVASRTMVDPLTTETTDGSHR
ncbi:thioesterase domain-containing protein [Streptomyces sp. NPDC016172]|uniref:thioesterase domain-containing protein n=1 Tax=Streptomyces sp. NPDC016172 TaxID=3364964 RepID=UPI0036FC1014